MDLIEFQQTQWAAFLIAAVFGAVAFRTNFCTMGAVSDIVNIGDSGRMRAWVLAMVVAIFGVAVLEYLQLVDMSLTQSQETARPPYRAPLFPWPRFVLGGLLFGIGMTLGSGCGNRTLVRIGGGNLKSVLVFLAMGIAAYLMIFTNFGYHVFLRWMEPAFINLPAWGVEDQSLGAFVSAASGLSAATAGIAMSLLVVTGLLVWVLRSREFLRSPDNLLSGLALGGCVVAAWWMTAGETGQFLLEEASFLEADEMPYALGAQSLTFVQPSAIFLRYLETGLDGRFLNFALLAGFGIAVGSLLYALAARRFRIEWFRSGADVVRHLVGGALMGFGGVLAIGCTIGQAVSGVSTLALGSFLTFGSICLGCALTLKVQYYRMVYEEEASVVSALVTGLADLHLIPDRWRRHESV